MKKTSVCGTCSCAACRRSTPQSTKNSETGKTTTRLFLDILCVLSVAASLIWKPAIIFAVVLFILEKNEKSEKKVKKNKEAEKEEAKNKRILMIFGCIILVIVTAGIMVRFAFFGIDKETGEVITSTMGPLAQMLKFLAD